MSLLETVAVGSAAGVAVGGVLGWWALRLLTTTHRRAWLCGPMATAPVTAVLVGLVAWRSDNGVDLALGSVLAAVSAPLSAIDILEQRLPVRLVWPAYIVAGSLVATGGITDRHADAPVRSIAAMAALLALYGLIALLSRGGLQLGDVRLAGLHGLVLGWLSWQVVVAATAASFALGGLAGLMAIARHGRSGATIPFGPAMSAGALTALIVLHR